MISLVLIIMIFVLQSLEGAEEYDFEGFLDDLEPRRQENGPDSEPLQKSRSRNNKGN